MSMSTYVRGFIPPDEDWQRMNDHDQAVPGAAGGARCWEDSQPGRYPCGCNGTAHWHPEPEPLVTGYLPDPHLRCSAFWYAQRAGLIAGDGSDLDFLRELGYQAACRARWEGVPEWRVREGPWIVHMWPERYFSWAADVMAQAAAEHGDWHLRRPDPPSAAIPRDPHCDRCNYDTHRCPGCGEPLPHGTEVCAACGRPRPEDSFWSYPAPPEDTMAYADWCQMADETAREESEAAAWGGQRPSASYQEWRREGLSLEEDRIPPRPRFPGTSRDRARAGCAAAGTAMAARSATTTRQRLMTRPGISESL